MSRGNRTTHRLIPAVISFVLLSVMATASRAQSTAPQNMEVGSQSGTLGGLVVNQAGEPLTSATVYVSTPGLDSSGRSAKVDANGIFKIEGLDVGVYSVFAAEPGFVLYPPLSLERRYYHTGDFVRLTLIKGGVITGTVTTAENAPVVAAAVRAFRVKDENGQLVPNLIQTSERLTDDRGIYRIYGLMPGLYVVSVGGQPRAYSGVMSPYDGDAPTYAPSATRDTASEIVVRSGGETIVDIQYRGDPGHALSGTVSGVSESQALMTPTAQINLTEVGTHTLLTSTATSSASHYGFAFYGVPDGEYELTASQYFPTREITSSEVRRVKVQGADITGINLSLAPLASIAGQLVFEGDPKLNCVKRRAAAARETLILARPFIRERKPGPSQKGKTEQGFDLSALVNPPNESAADAKGDFTLRNLKPGTYRIDPVFPEGGWYLRAVSIGTATGLKNPGSSITRDGITLKSGERVSGLTLTFTEGAATLHGRISFGEDQAQVTGLRVYLVPFERKGDDDVLRFFETRVDKDGTFLVANIAPGHYWIIARPDDYRDPANTRSIRLDADLRADVLREAESLKKEISFQPCQRSIEYDLRYIPVSAAPKR